MTDTHATLPQDDNANPAHIDARSRLPAEVKFDKRVYGGISYFAQAGSGILLTNWLKHGGGRQHFSKIAQWLGPNFMSLVSSKKGTAAIEEATGTIIVSTMIMVGNAFLLPVKWLEKRKPQIVRGMTESDNRHREAHGEVIAPEERQAQEENLAALERKPRQGWLSLGLGRGFALGSVYAVLWGIGNKNNVVMEEGMLKGIQGSLNIAGLKDLARSKTLENYSRIAFYDLFYSAVSAGGLYAYSHFIHPFKHTPPTDEVLPPMEEAVLEAVEPAPRRVRNPAQPSPVMRVESLAHPEPQPAEARA